MRCNNSCYSLGLGLAHETKEVRASCLRALRYVCHNDEHIDAIVSLNLDYLIARYVQIYRYGAVVLQLFACNAFYLLFF